MSKMIFPADVKLEVVTIRRLKAPDGRLWEPGSERTARRLNATHTLCSECLDELATYVGGLCSYCSHKKRQKAYWAITKTTSEFPISLDGEKFFWDEGDLEDYCEENECSPDDLLLYGCEIKAFDELDDSWWDDQKTEDGGLPDEIHALIADFNKKLSDISGYWYCDDKTRFVMPKDEELAP